jgi:hypothetical protein
MVGHASDALWHRAMLFRDCPKVRPKPFSEAGIKPRRSIPRAEYVVHEDRAESVGNSEGG